jgi:hypothetical protein
VNTRWLVAATTHSNAPYTGRRIKGGVARVINWTYSQAKGGECETFFGGAKVRCGKPTGGIPA